MATVRTSFVTRAALADVWDAMSDVGALHSRLVAGFVTSTVMDGQTRIVTFASGTVVREPIVSIDEDLHRVVWTSEGGMASHYNGAVRATAGPDGSTFVEWIADVLPNELEPMIRSAMEAGSLAMEQTLGRLA